MFDNSGKAKGAWIILILIIWVAAMWVIFWNDKGDTAEDGLDIPDAPPAHELGGEDNPIKMYFVPSLEADKVLLSGQEMADLIHQRTGYNFEVAVPTSYAAVIEAMGAGKADIAWLATFAYVLAHERYGADVGLTTVRNGLQQYRGQFVARADSDIDGVEDIEGRVIAYTDAASTSGFIYPSGLLQQQKIKPREFFYAGGHPQAILAVYEGSADVGCTYWSPVDSTGMPRDARFRLYESHPDVFDKIKIVGYTDWIPNDTVTFAKDFPQDVREKIIEALLDVASTQEGRDLMIDLYEVDGFVRSQNSDYDVVRQTLEALDFSAEKFIQ